jgi:hypothetical protein
MPTDTKEAKPSPVPSWRNRQLDGNALCLRSIWEDRKVEVEQARAQQALYEESIPQDPQEAIRQALETLHSDGDEHVKGLDFALHALVAVNRMARYDLDDVNRDIRDAMEFLTREAFERLEEALAVIDHVSKLVGAAFKGAEQR